MSRKYGDRRLQKNNQRTLKYKGIRSKSMLRAITKALETWISRQLLWECLDKPQAKQSLLKIQSKKRRKQKQWMLYFQASKTRNKKMIRTVMKMMKHQKRKSKSQRRSHKKWLICSHLETVNHLSSSNNSKMFWEICSADLLSLLCRHKVLHTDHCKSIRRRLEVYGERLHTKSRRRWSVLVLIRHKILARWSIRSSVSTWSRSSITKSLAQDNQLTLVKTMPTFWCIAVC